MCVGVPMQVIEVQGLAARCASRDGEHMIDVGLVGTVQPGDWIMTFLGAAREVISEDAARATSNALVALEMAMRGETDIDHLFADLVDREPELPEHLRPKRESA